MDGEKNSSKQNNIIDLRAWAAMEEERLEKRMSEIRQDIEAYKEAVENLEGALAEAERELLEEIECRAALRDADGDCGGGLMSEEERESASWCDDSIADYPEYERDAKRKIGMIIQPASKKTPTSTIRRS